MFSNTVLPLEEIPQIEPTDFQPLEDDYLWLRISSWCLLYLIIGGVATLTVFKSEAAWWMILGPVILLFLFTMFVEIKGFKIKGFSLREKDISFKRGLLFYSMTTIPFNRVQHCEVTQGPLARLFDLASVKVYTAGGSSSDLSIGGLTKERAQNLRDFITKLSAEHE